MPRPSGVHAGRRVLIDATSLWDGGSNRNYHRNLLHELDRDPRGFSFTVLAPKGELSTEEVGSHELIEVSFPRRSRALFRVLWQQARLPAWASGYDLVFCTTDLSPAWGSTPTVVLLGNLNIYDRRFYDTPRTRLLFQLARRGARNANAVVTPSAVASEAVQHALSIPAEKVHVVPHGITQEAFSVGSYRSESGAPYVFLPSNLERHKNIRVMIECLAYLEEPRVEIIVAGGRGLDEAHARELEDFAVSRGVADRVHFIGAVAYEDVLSYYRGATALVFSSLLESFGFPMLEAMLAEAPIIASDLPIFHEIAGDSAQYFSPQDPRALAEAILSVIDRPEEAARRVALGKERVKQFSWSHSVDCLCEVFERVLGAPV